MSNTDSTLIEEIPTDWDGFGFYRGTDGRDRFYFFDEMVRVHGPIPKDPSIPADREPYHVLLSSARHGHIYIEEPFVAHFLDPMAYARHLMDAKFLGTMIRKSAYSVDLVKQSLNAIMTYHAKASGFFYPINGVLTFFKGEKQP